METLGTFIRRTRDEKDISLREFARRVGVSAAFASDIELGRRFPSDDMLERIAEVLDSELTTLRKLDTRAPIAAGRNRLDHRSVHAPTLVLGHLQRLHLVGPPGQPLVQWRRPAEVIPALRQRVLSPRMLISPRLSRSLGNNIIPCQRFIVY